MHRQPPDVNAVSSAGVGPTLGAYGCDMTGEGGRKGGCAEFGFQACSGNSPRVVCHSTLLDRVVPQTRNLDSSARSVDEEADPNCLPPVISAYSPPLPLKQKTMRKSHRPTFSEALLLPGAVLGGCYRAAEMNITLPFPQEAVVHLGNVLLLVWDAEWWESRGARE